MLWLRFTPLNFGEFGQNLDDPVANLPKVVAEEGPEQILVQNDVIKIGVEQLRMLDGLLQLLEKGE